MLFHGLSAFPITPMDRHGRVDADGLGALLRRLGAAEAINSVGLLGSTGSYMFLEREERRRAVEIAVREIGGQVPIIVGVGSLRTDDACALALDARSAGADGLLLAPVSYTPLTEDEVFTHFSAVAEAGQLPLCIYNNPGTTHFTFGNGLLQRLAEVPNICAVKNPALAVDDIQPAHDALKAMVPADFAIGYSGDWHAAGAILAGGKAWYSVIGGLLPEPTGKLMRAAQAGDRAEIARINGHFEPLWGLFKSLSSYRVVHAAADMLGLCRCEPPLPILPLGDADRQSLGKALKALDGV